MSNDNSRARYASDFEVRAVLRDYTEDALDTMFSLKEQLLASETLARRLSVR